MSRFPEINDNDLGDEDQFGRLARTIPAGIRARAAAEWEAMDEDGRLPEGWAYEPENAS